MAQPDPTKLAYAISLIESKGISLRKLARKDIGSHSAIGKWLKGEGYPRDITAIDRLIDAAESYGKGATEIKLEAAGVRHVTIMPPMVHGAPDPVSSPAYKVVVRNWQSPNPLLGRQVNDGALRPLLEPGDAVVIEKRKHEPGQVVLLTGPDGTDYLRVAKGSGAKERFVALVDDYEPMTGSQFQVVGVAVMRIRKGKRDTSHTSEYPHGMSEADALD